MADYDKRYALLGAPQPRNDGSGMVAHDIEAQASVAGEGVWATVPGRHKTVLVPEVELEAALAAGGTSAILAAYKQALVSNLNTVPVAVTGWDADSLETLLDANDKANAAAGAANLFITVTLGLSYPVPFTI